MRSAISSSTSRGVKSTRRRTKLKRVPRTPAAWSASSSASRHVAPYRGDAARPAAGVDERVDERAVVVAVTGRLHDDVALEPEVVAQREQLFLRGVAGRVLALGRIGERRARPEHVAMRVHRAGRHHESRLRRVRVEGQIVGIHDHDALRSARASALELSRRNSDPPWPAARAARARPCRPRPRPGSALRRA